SPFFYTDPSPTAIYTLSLHDALPIFSAVHKKFQTPHVSTWIAGFVVGIPSGIFAISDAADLSNIGTLFAFVLVSLGVIILRRTQDRKSTRLNSSHLVISYAVFCLKKK